MAASRMLAVRTAKGGRTRVHVDGPKKLQGLRTGMQVKVTGTWAAPRGSGGSGGVQTAMGATRAPRFEASAITASGGAGIAGPTVVTERLSASGTVPAAGATPAAGPLAFTSTNRLAARNISVLVIPREGALSPLGNILLLLSRCRHPGALAATQHPSCLRSISNRLPAPLPLGP